MRGRTVGAVFVAVTVIGFAWTGGGHGVQNPGAEKLILYGGKTGDVYFPHHQHQNVLKDCNVCHEVFAQKAGVIEEMKSQKTLKKKQVMNKQCIKCHRQKKKAGEKTGPTTCKKCHTTK